MDITVTLDQIKTLDLNDRIQLVQAIWDSIADETGHPELTDADKQGLDDLRSVVDHRRIAEHDANPDNVLTWEELKASMQYSR
jgi:putative addiction module component (TIGR02574 family)